MSNVNYDIKVENVKFIFEAVFAQWQMFRTQNHVIYTTYYSLEGLCMYLSSTEKWRLLCTIQYSIAKIQSCYLQIKALWTRNSNP